LFLAQRLFTACFLFPFTIFNHFRNLSISASEGKKGAILNKNFSRYVVTVITSFGRFKWNVSFKLFRKVTDEGIRSYDTLQARRDITDEKPVSVHIKKRRELPLSLV
jgi:hypothetical protein